MCFLLKIVLNCSKKWSADAPNMTGYEKIYIYKVQGCKRNRCHVRCKYRSQVECHAWVNLYSTFMAYQVECRIPCVKFYLESQGEEVLWLGQILPKKKQCTQWLCFLKYVFNIDLRKCSLKCIHFLGCFAPFGVPESNTATGSPWTDRQSVAGSSKRRQ